MKNFFLLTLVVLSLAGCAAQHDPAPDNRSFDSDIGDMEDPKLSSFENVKIQVLQPHCLRCHSSEKLESGQNGRLEGGVDLSREEFLFTQELVVPGDPASSYIVQIIQTGEMPTRGAPVTGPGLELLKKYILELSQNNQL